MDPLSIAIAAFVLCLLLGLVWGIMALDHLGTGGFFWGIFFGVAGGLFWGTVAYVIAHFVIKFW